MSDVNDHLDSLVDTDALSEYLATELGDTESFDVSYHDEGHSNEIIFFNWGDGEYALRRPPSGKTPESAHDVLREYEVLSALSETAVPVPETVFACNDHSVIGSDFFVMQRLDGTVIHNDTGEPSRFAEPEYREQISSELVETLAKIHDVDYERIGLGNFGSPEKYLSKQIALWTNQMEQCFKRSGREIDALRDTAEWLADSIPEPIEPTLVHGDYKLDNVIFSSGTPPEIIGVFDWEMSTLGDPLADVGYMLFNWEHGTDNPAVPELFPQFTEYEGYPSQRELVEMYEDASGRTYRHDRFYRALAGFKLGTALEAFYARYLEGTTTDSMYPSLEAGIPELANRIQRIIDGKEPLS
ncbi:phosphotransferase family protein [Natrinema sp. 1APR25-10V2]|uniref:phosphotransferase family protein n=1 Tax=Natrinema sp. 1APR25-10V2 TaxID=2951081 RepID=UPI00287602D7|nr:phosphotransferase family protein [Natrinema sp. 1APR25-10V2]MDS0476950.1 phosphotransferase family protein [Natrinema sp. 1APR25-10V2]